MHLRGYGRQEKRLRSLTDKEVENMARPYQKEVLDHSLELAAEFMLNGWFPFGRKSAPLDVQHQIIGEGRLPFPCPEAIVVMTR